MGEQHGSRRAFYRARPGEFYFDVTGGPAHATGPWISRELLPASLGVSQLEVEPCFVVHAVRRDGDWPPVPAVVGCSSDRPRGRVKQVSAAPACPRLPHSH